MIENRRAKFDYFFEEVEDAGIVLLGWEVKSIKAGKADLTSAYVIFKDEEAFLFGALITPLKEASTHVPAEPTRTRKLLMTKRQLRKWHGKKVQSGYTIVPVDIHWSDSKKIKVKVALAKGKKEYDKRNVEKERDVKRQINQAMKER
jgi:SsrA-binding protein